MIKKEKVEVYVTHDGSKFHTLEEATHHEVFCEMSEYFDNIVLYNITAGELALEIADDWDNFKKMVNSL